MTFASATQFHVYLPWVWVKACFLNVKAIVAAFNQKKALAGAFSVIRNLRVDLRSQLYY